MQAGSKHRQSNAETTQGGAAGSPSKAGAYAALRKLPNDVTNELGKAVKRFRIAADKSQMELAFDGELERTLISRIERGVGNPSVLTLATLCYCLGITLDQLFSEVKVNLAPQADGGPIRRRNPSLTGSAQGKGSRKSPLR